MGELGLNKIFGALLAVALAVLGLKEISTIVFGGGHHAHHEYESLNGWAEENFAYRVDIPETGGGADVIEEVYDLGLLMASADVSKGERSFKGKCATCHTVDNGGANGTGPNLYNIVGADKGAIAGFGYSGALDSTEGNWSYENMDDWLRAPSRYARGTNMAFAGINRDDERANVLAYLASYTPDAPAFPDPLPAVEEASLEEAEGDEAATDAAVVDEGADIVEPVEAIVEQTVEPALTAPEATIEAVVEEASDAAEAAETSVIETVTETAEDTAGTVEEAVQDQAGDIVEVVTETAEDLVETPEAGDEN